MKLIVTANELNRAFCWLPFCDLRGLNSYAMNEGLVAADDEFTLTLEEVRKIGLADAVARAIAATWPPR